ncbi:lysophospholipase D GDPD1-like [Oscarella lobularis]|uniref:lysophospholipase D GDPD1-like n=1 Tax=Oscarella lobularis TaxID=121494 RepID=UPI003313D5BF
MGSIIVGSVLGGAFLAYFCASTTLFFFPSLLHRKKKFLLRVKHISHRGGAGEELENTVAAYQNALKNGTDMLELDVQLSKDGKVVVSHDNNLQRTTGVDTLISQTDYSNLPKIKKELPVQFMKDRVVSIDHDDNVIPTLDEVFEKFPNTPMNIDIKYNSDELIDKVHALISQHNRQHITVWGSMNYKNGEKLYEKDPSIPLFFSPRRVFLTYVLLLTGLLPFWPIKETCYEMCWPSTLIKRANLGHRLPGFVRCFAWLLDRNLVHRALYYHLKRRGVSIYVWVLNDVEDYERAENLGASAIMTDLPSHLSAYYARNAHRSSRDKLIS